MSRREVLELIDDLDGRVLPDGGGETVTVTRVDTAADPAAVRAWAAAHGIRVSNRGRHGGICARPPAERHVRMLTVRGRLAEYVSGDSAATASPVVCR